MERWRRGGGVERGERRGLRYLGARGRVSDDEVRRARSRRARAEALLARGPGRGLLLPVESEESVFDDAEDRVHWVEIVMLGEDDEPVGGIDYEIELPDGSLRRGRLGPDGRARIENIASSGSCKVRFPRLDEAAWEPIA